MVEILRLYEQLKAKDNQLAKKDEQLRVKDVCRLLKKISTRPAQRVDSQGYERAGNPLLELDEAMRSAKAGKQRIFRPFIW